MKVIRDKAAIAQLQKRFPIKKMNWWRKLFHIHRPVKASYDIEVVRYHFQICAKCRKVVALVSKVRGPHKRNK